MCIYVCDRGAQMHPCIFDRNALMHIFGKNRHAHVRACGENNHAHEVKWRGVKKLVFVEILMFLWVVMSEQVLFMWI